MKYRKSDPKIIKIKSLCLIEHKGKILLNKFYDKVKRETFYRVIGGTVNFREKHKDAVKREVKEELKSGLKNLKFIGVDENIFTLRNIKCHEIFFLYKGDLTSKKIYQQKKFEYLDGEKVYAEWVPKELILKNKVILYPPFDYRKILSK